jgi:hypothetical protein
MDSRPSKGHACCLQTAFQRFQLAVDSYVLWPSVGLGRVYVVTWNSAVVLSPESSPRAKQVNQGFRITVLAVIGNHPQASGIQRLVLINRLQINLERWNETYFPATLSEKGQILRDAVADKHVVWLHRVPESPEQVDLGGVAKAVLRDLRAVINNDSNSDYDSRAGGSGAVGFRLIGVNGLDFEYNSTLRLCRIDGHVFSNEEGGQ